MENKIVGIAYIPVLHSGYLKYLLELEEQDVEELYLVSDDILVSHEELDYINRKDRLRALPHEMMMELIGTATSLKVFSLTTATIFALHEDRAQIIAPREDINEFIIETYFGGHRVTYSNVFLRWHKDNVGEDTAPQSAVVELSNFQKSITGSMFKEAEMSADWWRQVGAVLVKEGTVVAIAHNEHMPEEEMPNIVGDTRALFKKGVNINYVTSAHAEVGVLGEAARQGISTEGAELFVTDFPCPYCARLIAKAGIKKVYYARGYAVLGGDTFFEDMHIEIARVAIPE